MWQILSDTCILYTSGGGDELNETETGDQKMNQKEREKEKKEASKMRKELPKE